MGIGIIAGLAGLALIGTLVSFVITLLITGFMIYIAGRMVVGGRATFGKAIAIAFVGSLLGFVLTLLLPFFGWAIALIVWIYLIKIYFNTGWLSALAVGIVAVVVSVVIAIIVGIVLGVTLLGLL